MKSKKVDSLAVRKMSAQYTRQCSDKWNYWHMDSALGDRQ